MLGGNVMKREELAKLLERWGIIIGEDESLRKHLHCTHEINGQVMLQYVTNNGAEMRCGLCGEMFYAIPARYIDDKEAMGALNDFMNHVGDPNEVASNKPSGESETGNGSNYEKEFWGEDESKGLQAPTPETIKASDAENGVVMSEDAPSPKTDDKQRKALEEKSDVTSEQSNSQEDTSDDDDDDGDRITSVKIEPVPNNTGKMEVFVETKGGRDSGEPLFEFQSEILSFTVEELVGLTLNEAIELREKKEKEYFL